jgi:Flp pilus assembly protein TadD
VAQHSIDVLGTRAGPWQIKALCDLRKGQYRRAQVALRGGLAVDPHDWELQAALAAATAARGFDARAQAATALRLNPEDADIQALADALAHGPSVKARTAARLYLSEQQTLIVSG